MRYFLVALLVIFSFEIAHLLLPFPDTQVLGFWHGASITIARFASSLALGWMAGEWASGLAMKARRERLYS